MRPLNAPEWPFVGEIHRVEDTYWRFLKTGWTEFVPTEVERAQHAITEAAEEAAHHDRMCELISMGISTRTARTNTPYINTVEREEGGYHVRLELRMARGVLGYDHFIADAHLEAAVATPLLFNSYMDSWVRSMIKQINIEAERGNFMTEETMNARMRAISDMSSAMGIATKEAAEKFAEFSRMLTNGIVVQPRRKI